MQPDVESSLLGVLLTANSARQGAELLLEVLRPLTAEEAVAIAFRDRDGVTLHILAEDGPPQSWPAKLEPQFALNGSAGVDPGTNAYVIPLRSKGRVVGGLLFGDAVAGSEVGRAIEAATITDTLAAVVHALASRTDAELRRHAQAVRSVEPILEGIAHQLANPLAGASAIAQLLVDELPDDAQRGAVRQIMHELNRAFGVLKDLADFRRDTQAQDGVLDLNAVVEQVLRFRGYAIREQGIAVDVETAPGYLPVRADLRSLEHALLLALRHAELQSHGTVNRAISVRVAELGAKELSVAIVDSGPGTVPDLTPRYLDTPFHGHGSARLDEQPDLGLVASIARASGGRLEHTSSKEDGTTLTLVLPRAATRARSSHPTLSAAAGRIPS